MTPSALHKPPPHWLFGVLVIPFGVAVGYAQVAVPFILKARGLSIETIAGISALSSAPHGWKFLWAPALDAGYRRKSFYLAMIALTALALAGTALVPPDGDTAFGPVSLLAIYSSILALSQATVATSSSAADALMAVTLPESDKGRASGWYNAGNLGGTGVGGALATWLSGHTSPGLTAASLAGICVACGLPALWIHEPAPVKHPLGKAMRELLIDLWTFVRSRTGWTGLVICLSPVAAGAAATLFSAFAGDYGAGEYHVEVVNGVLGGLISSVGCIVGGYLADRMSRRACYVLAGGLAALVAAGMALTPATPTTFTVGCLAYSFVIGIGYAAFTAFVLEMIGHGPGVATKYALCAGASNQAIAYMTFLDGKGYSWGGRVGLLAVDAAAGVVGILVLGAMTAYLGRKGQEAPAAG